MPSKEALARRNKFVDAKNDAGGYDQLREISKTSPVLIYFDATGTIMGISRTRISNKDWKYQSFTEEQVGILKGKNINLFRMRQDLKEESLYHLEVRPTEDLFVRSDTDALYLIPETKEDEKYEIQVYIKGRDFWVTMHSDIQAQYNDIPVDEAIINGQRSLRFYITAKGDPHFLLRDLSFPLSNLIKNKTCGITLPKFNYKDADIYTVKLFNKYIRT